MILPWLLSGGWRYAVMGLLLMVVGVQHIELVNIKSGIARAEAKALEVARAKDAENTALAASVDQANLEKRDALDKAADSAHTLARTRGLYVHTRCNLPSAPANPGLSEGGAAQSRISDADSDAILTIARDADRAALYAQACHEWAIKIGRP